MNADTSALGEAELFAMVRSLGIELVLLPCLDGIVLEGTSPTYYGKQMAQVLARRAGLAIVANRIAVARWNAATAAD
jgi:hypothetical protein